MVKRYLFFLRHYNDIDNITPAIYFFLDGNEKHRADVVLYDGAYDYRNNENLAFLSVTFGDRFSYKWLGEYMGLEPERYLEKKTGVKKNSYSLDLIKQALISLFKIFGISNNSVKESGRRLKKIFGKTKITNTDIGRMCRGEYENPEQVKNILEKILKEINYPSLVIFDINRTPEIKGLLNSLRTNGVKKIICLPVSPLISYNTLRQEKLVDLNSEHFLMLHDYSGVDAVGYVDNYFVESYNKTFKLLGVDSTLRNKTSSLGSIRYCSAWLKIREAYVNPFELKTEKIKTVFFLSRPVTNVNWNEVERIFKFFLNYPQYELVVKHHTRDETNQDKKRYPHIKFVNDINSSSLINWAEVVLFWSTSVAIEGYIKKKTMVCLNYVSGNKNLYELVDAGFVAKCRDDLHEFLEIYKTNKASLPYNAEGIRKLLDEIIIPSGDEVISNYLQFMLENESISGIEK